MAKILRKDAFQVIDIDYFEKFGIDGLETVIGNKEDKIEEIEEKEDKFWAIMNEETTTVLLMNGEVIKGFNLKKLNGFKFLLTQFDEKGYKVFDDVIFPECDVGYGVKERKTNFKAVDGILQKIGIKKPTSKEATKVFRDIFWVSRRKYQKDFIKQEIEEIKKLVEIRKDEDNTWDDTQLDDFFDDDTNINFFDLE